MPKAWWEAVKRGCARWNTDPYGVAALMVTECYSKRRGPWVDGPVGRYQGPCGMNPKCRIFKQYPEKLVIPELQIEHACYLLRGDLVARIKIYNPLWDQDNYLEDLLELKEQMENRAWEEFLAKNRLTYLSRRW